MSVHLFCHLLIINRDVSIANNQGRAGNRRAEKHHPVSRNTKLSCTTRMPGVAVSAAVC
jgi:hypothetical protein